jgi:NAD(P)-dependent dehydrogenase (short-subunit alcohol dehydrogenase family)
MTLKDKVAIVTGSSRGIGLGIARVFVAEGARVAIVSPDRAEGEQVASELNAVETKAVYIQTDVKENSQIQKMIETTVDSFGQLDILVNNAGTHNSKNAEETSEEDWDFILNTNLRGTFLCSKYAIGHLRQTRGNIINISSMVGLVGQSNAAAYAASKGGQIALTKNMAIDLAPDVRVNVICPAWVQTPLVEEWFNMQDDPAAAREYIFGRHPAGRIGTIEECGHLAAYLASEKAAFITGSVMTFDGGITLGY